MSATQTTNLGLNKPDRSDYVSVVNDLNDNMDIIDGAYGNLATGKVPSTRKVNGHALSSDVTVTKGDVGLGNVDNTSDANKPISNAQALVNTNTANQIIDLKSALNIASNPNGYSKVAQIEGLTNGNHDILFPAPLLQGQKITFTGSSTNGVTFAFYKMHTKNGSSITNLYSGVTSVDWTYTLPVGEEIYGVRLWTNNGSASADFNYSYKITNTEQMVLEQVCKHFDTGKDYKVGEFAENYGNVYEFISDKPAGVWNASGNVVRKVSVAEILTENKEDTETKITDIETDISENAYSIDKTVNVVERGIFEIGFIDDTNGKEIGHNINNSRTGFIELNDSPYITFFRTDTSYSLYVFFYNSSKEFLSAQEGISATSGRISVPSNSKYIRLATYKSTSTGLIDPYGDLVVSFIFPTYNYYVAPEYLPAKKTFVHDIEEIGASANLANQYLKWHGSGVGSDGQLYTYKNINASWVSDMIDLGEVGIAKVNVMYRRQQDVTVYYHQYNANKEYIGETTVGKNNSFRFAPNTLTRYIRLSTWNNTYTTEADCKLYDMEIYVNKNSLTGYESIAIPKAKKVIPFEYLGRDIYDPWFIPEYYYQMLHARIETLMPLCMACRNNGDSFIFITDSHWARFNQQHSPALIRYLSKYLNIDKLFHGGDLADGVKGWWTDGTKVNFDPTWHRYSIQQIKLLREAIDGKAMFTVGNHEYFLQSNDRDVNYQLMTYLPNDVVYGSLSRNYYYYDNTLAKVRYIVLNAYSYNGQDYSCAEGYESDQRNWLRDTALNVPSGYLIVVISHSFYDFDDPDEATTYHAVNQYVIDILNNYSGDGEIACLIQGHTHIDRIIETAENGLKCVMVTCDKNVPYTGEETMLDYRTTGTDQEQAFDVVTLSRTNRTVTFTRVGGLAYNGIGANWGSLVNQRVITF